MSLSSHLASMRYENRWSIKALGVKQLAREVGVDTVIQFVLPAFVADLVKNIVKVVLLQQKLLLLSFA